MEDFPMNAIEKEYLVAYEENMPRIFRHIFSRVNDRAIAEDLTSETFFAHGITSAKATLF